MTARMKYKVVSQGQLNITMSIKVYKKKRNRHSHGIKITPQAPPCSSNPEYRITELRDEFEQRTNDRRIVLLSHHIHQHQPRSIKSKAV